MPHDSPRQSAEGRHLPQLPMHRMGLPDTTVASRKDLLPPLPSPEKTEPALMPRKNLNRRKGRTRPSGARVDWTDIENELHRPVYRSLANRTESRP